MSEEEIINNLNQIIDNCNAWIEDAETDTSQLKWFMLEKQALQGFLDLYNKEKSLNEELQIRYKIEHQSKIDRYICKDKIKALLNDVNATLNYAKNNDLVDVIFYINGVKNSLEELLEN